MIAIIDYQAGNLQSVQKALAYLGAEHRTLDRPGGLDDCDSIFFDIFNAGHILFHLLTAQNPCQRTSRGFRGGAGGSLAE